MSQNLTDHAVNVSKVATGGIGVAATTYQTVLHLSVDQATAYATLSAAVMTTIYFAVVTVIAVLKWVKDKKAD